MRDKETTETLNSFYGIITDSMISKGDYRQLKEEWLKEDNGKLVKYATSITEEFLSKKSKHKKNKITTDNLLRSLKELENEK